MELSKLSARFFRTDGTLRGVGGGGGLEDELAEEYGKDVSVEIVNPNAQPGDSPNVPEVTATAEATVEIEAGAGQGDEDLTTDEDGEIDLENLSEGEQEALGRLNTYFEDLKEEVRKEIRDEEIPRVQSGFDRQINSLKEENVGLHTQLDQINQQMRDQTIAHMTPQEQDEIRKGWAHEDTAKRLEKTETNLLAYHDDLTAYDLFLQYRDYGVTAEELADVPADERIVYCKDAQIAWIEAHPGQKPGVTTNGAAVKPGAVPEKTPTQTAQRKPAPAGSRAASDTGHSAPPAPTPKQVEGKGPDAMAASLADRDSWESVGFQRTRTG